MFFNGTVGLAAYDYDLVGVPGSSIYHVRPYDQGIYNNKGTLCGRGPHWGVVTGSMEARQNRGFCKVCVARNQIFDLRDVQERGPEEP